ncbi:GNAT family N-acetyltransferase [Vibrio panuliri]|uniref:GNAT family N-acetyltransferase n=1 Tax=Vibrio panuliri TaxID=1381081 RepID=A0A1Q9HQH5_9VIBR|nr:GNAT family protein [Vibrio panuliri]OLQ93127.1 GNAT family N-acetyltransferase [Vibrio panuliri]
MFKLESRRVILRDMQLSDEAAFVELTQDEKYQRFYSEEDCRAEKYRQLTQLFIEQAQAQPRIAYQLAIEDKLTGNFIGTVCLRLESDQQASIGCGMSRRYQGTGLMQEAASLLVDYGFNQLGVHRMYAETISENRAAIRLCKYLGMVEEGRFHQHRFFKNQWWDTLVLAIRSNDWQQRSTVILR